MFEDLKNLSCVRVISNIMILDKYVVNVVNELMSKNYHIINDKYI